jgi:predicted kinase
MIADKARRAVAAGHSAVVDAVYAKPQERAALERSAAVLVVPFHGLFLVADLDTRLNRVGSRRGDASDADAGVARAQENYDLGTLHWTRIDASGSLDETLTLAKAVVGTRQLV